MVLQIGGASAGPQDDIEALAGPGVVRQYFAQAPFCCLVLKAGRNHFVGAGRLGR